MTARIWIVTDPKPTSTVGDCVFETDATGFVRQVLGGLREQDRPEFHDFREAALEALAERIAGRPGFDRLRDEIAAVLCAINGLRTYEHVRPDGRVVRMTVPR